MHLWPVRWRQLSSIAADTKASAIVVQLWRNSISFIMFTAMLYIHATTNHHPYLLQQQVTASCLGSSDNRNAIVVSLYTLKMDTFPRELQRIASIRKHSGMAEAQLSVLLTNNWYSCMGFTPECPWAIPLVCRKRTPFSYSRLTFQLQKRDCRILLSYTDSCRWCTLSIWTRESHMSK